MSGSLTPASSARNRILLSGKLAKVAALKAAATGTDLAGYIHALVQRDASRRSRPGRTEPSNRSRIRTG